MNYINIKTLLLLLAFTLMNGVVWAQGAPPSTPIDGGLSLLLVAGGLYGIKKVKDFRK